MNTEQSIPYPWQEKNWNDLMLQATQNRLSHAYIVCGPSGIGKFEFVLKFSKFLLCDSSINGLPCGDCPDCILHNNMHPNLRILKPESEGSEIKVDQVRSLIEFFSVTGHSKRLKVCIINEAHRLNINATNALLKTLEEPAGSSVILLCSSHLGLLSPTLKSRCQKFPIDIPSREVSHNWLKANIKKRVASDILARVSETCPLKLKELIETDCLVKQDAFLANFLNLLKGRAQVRDVINDAMSLGEHHASYCLKQILSRGIVLFLSNQMPVSNSAEDTFIKILNGSSLTKRALALILFKYYDQSNEAYEEIAFRHNNLNKQLIIESLIWRASQLNFGLSS